MSQPSNIYVVHADMTQLGAAALVFSTADRFDGGGQMYAAFVAGIKGFSEGYEQLRRRRPQAKIGDGFWIPIEHASPIEGVVAVVTVGDRRPVRDATEASVEGAIAAAVLHVHPDGNQRPLIALPAFHTGHGGGHRKLLEMAELQIRTAERVIRERCLDAYDFVFCTYTSALHHIYRDARQRVLGSPAAFKAPPGELVAAIRQRECAFFIGSGMSAGAGLPSWSKLVGRLSSDLGLTTPVSADLEYFLDLAQWHRESAAGAPLEEIARELFDTRRLGLLPTLAHYLTLALPFRQVITTNYDSLIEQTFDGLRRRYHQVVHQGDVALTGRSDGTCVVKLHGDAASGSNIVLSRDDYDSFFNKRPAMAAFLEGLLLNHTFLFVGYSLRDPNFRQIYSRIAGMLAEAKRPAYAVTFDEDNTHMNAQWANKGLHLIPVPGASISEKQTNLLAWLDRLAEAAIGSPQVFLAPDASGGSLDPLRAQLREIGDRVEDSCRRALDAEEARVVADLLVFLIGLGWRPRSNRPLCHLLEILADRVDDGDKRDQLLTRALEHTAKLTDAINIRHKLSE